MIKKESRTSVKIAVVIPCYKVCEHITEVISKIGPEVSRIYIVDDCCPDSSGEFVLRNCSDKRITVIRNAVNLGVGGAVIEGYKAALAEDIEIIIKLDGDGQMDPQLIANFVNPIIEGKADYTKGNRFFDLKKIQSMPKIRLLGNAILSFMTKFSSGYWNLFDPTNGYTAIHSDILRHLEYSKLSKRYFFETDMLFQLNILRAVVIDIPMDAKYGNEKSHLKISRVIGEFLFKHARNFCKRLFYNYYLRDMSLASFELPLGVFMLLFGLIFGFYHWISSWHNGVTTPLGTVMLSVLPLILGFQLILAFLAYDIASVPRRPLHLKYYKID
jgi:glycosyltransferase involved in cell wall biosynthesis